MPGEQIYLFPELDPFKTIIKNIDWVDLSTLPDIPGRKPGRQCSDLLPNKYILFKTGGSNLYFPDRGLIYPWIKNLDKGNQVPAKGHGTDGYPRVGLVTNQGCGINFKIHRLAAQAFIENPEKKPLVDHINKIITDYQIENLRHVTHQENSQGNIRGTYGVLSGTYGENLLNISKNGNGL